MKRVLIRSGFNYNEIDRDLTSDEILNRGWLAANSGNTLYLKSIYNLLNKNYECESDSYEIERLGSGFTNKRIDDYDVYVLPLADAFRKDYIQYLNNLTKMIRSSKKKVIVAGVGVRCNYDPGPNVGHSFDFDVKEFINAVLDTGSIIGVRGGITADYLKKLGYKDGQDFMIIGCPSMFYKDINVNYKVKNEKYAVNYSHLTEDRIIESLNSLIPSGNLICQHTMDYKLMTEYKEILFPTPEHYASNYENPFYKEIIKYFKFYSNPDKWIDSMKDYDITIGTRIHGNIASLLGGTPAIQIMIDSRTRELSEYFNIPRISKDEFLKLNKYMSVRSIIEQFTHFNNDLSIQKERYKEFWKLNGIEI